MVTYSTEQIKTMMRGDNDSRTPKLPNFKEIDDEVYSSNKAALKALGFTEKSLKEKYDKIPFADFTASGLKFGLGLGDLPKELYAGQLGTGSKYIDKRIGVLNELISLFESAQGPEDLHKITALLEMSKNALGEDDHKAVHYIEAIAAAKTAMRKDNEARKNFKDYEKSFIYDHKTFARTLNELIARRDHLQGIKDQGFDSWEEHGIVGRVADHGIGTAVQASSIYVTGKGIAKTPKVWGALNVFNNSTNQVARSTALNTLSKAPILSRLLGGLRIGGKFLLQGATKLIPAIPFWGQVAAVGAVAVGALAIAGSKLYMAYQNEDSMLHSAAKGIKDTYYGGANNFLAATASWILPGFGTLYGTQFFTSERQKNLSELRQGVAA